MQRTVVLDVVGLTRALLGPHAPNLSAFAAHCADMVDQLQYLYDNLNRADQRPSGDAIARHEELKAELDGHPERLERLLSNGG